MNPITGLKNVIRKLSMDEEKDQYSDIDWSHMRTYRDDWETSSKLQPDGEYLLRMSDNVLDEIRWNILRIKTQNGIVTDVKELRKGTYATDFITVGMPIEELQEWIDHDPTGSHPETYIDVYPLGKDSAHKTAGLFDANLQKVVTDLQQGLPGMELTFATLDGGKEIVPMEITTVEFDGQDIYLVFHADGLNEELGYNVDYETQALISNLSGQKLRLSGPDDAEWAVDLIYDEAGEMLTYDREAQVYMLKQRLQQDWKSLLEKDLSKVSL